MTRTDVIYPATKALAVPDVDLTATVPCTYEECSTEAQCVAFLRPCRHAHPVCEHHALAAIRDLRRQQTTLTQRAWCAICRQLVARIDINPL